jgi:DNA-binding NarL/FixJ family response regulator
VSASGDYFAPALSMRLLQWARRDTADGLTDRQIEVLKLLAVGKGAKEIGFELGLSARTIDVHRARIMKRLQVDTAAALTRYALRKGLIDSYGRAMGTGSAKFSVPGSAPTG